MGDEKVLCALSGGVDSAVAAASVLKTASPSEVAGITLGLWGGEREGTSCSTGDSTAAAAVAAELNIPHHILDYTQEFNEVVVNEFVSVAQVGGSSNPCVTCNKVFKAEKLFHWAELQRWDKVVTGHYAQVVQTPWGMRIARAVDKERDQSYVLCGFSPEHIQRLVTPLGKFSKDETRKLAQKWGLSVVDKKDSMGLCFSPDKVLAGLGEVDVVDESGNTVSSVRQGRATLGQRRGLGSGGSGERRYVVDITATRVQLGPRKDLQTANLQLSQWNWVGGEKVDVPLTFQVSAHGTANQGELFGQTIIWKTPQKKVASGQVVAGYWDNKSGHDILLGWGIVA